jgi:hypothetical protein
LILMYAVAAGHFGPSLSMAPCEPVHCSSLSASAIRPY